MNKILITLSLILFGSILSFGQSEMEEDYSKYLKKHRKDYKKALLADETSPLVNRKEVKSMSFFEADEAFKVKCLFIRATDEKPFEMMTFSDDTKPYIKYGELLFELPGQGTHRINIYQSLKALRNPMFKDHLFIPFKDLTNGETTFEGGRYLDLRVGDIEKGIVYLDFNKAYNPWCAYRNSFSCPMPPSENNLRIKIKAGEKSYVNLAQI